VYTYYPYIQPVMEPRDEPSQSQQQEMSNAKQSSDEQSGLQSELQQLRQEIADLKESQMLSSKIEAATEAPDVNPHSSEPNAPQSQDSTSEPIAVVVLHDARTVELHNYVITGRTLWNLMAGGMEEIALDDLDVAATRELNESRGLSRNAAAILDAANKNVDESSR
jgi:hypothetical protein